MNCMENIFNEEISKDIEKIKQVFMVLGFSDSESEQHLDKIGNILTAKFITVLLKNKGFQKQEVNDDEEISEFIKTNYTPEEAKSIIEGESKIFLKNYFETILKDVKEEKLAEINTIMSI